MKNTLKVGGKDRSVTFICGDSGIDPEIYR